MHYCSDEVSNYHHPPTTTPPAPETGGILFCGTDFEDLYSELEGSLSDLEEGDDVLMILDNTYECTVKEHVVNPLPEDAVLIQPLLKPSPQLLKTGSLTALLAVLEQPTGQSANKGVKQSSLTPRWRFRHFHSFAERHYTSSRSSLELASHMFPTNSRVGCTVIVYGIHHENMHCENNTCVELGNRKKLLIRHSTNLLHHPTLGPRNRNPFQIHL